MIDRSSDKRFQSSPGSLVFGVFTAAVAVSGLVLTIVFLLTDHPYRAVWTLALTCIVMGVARAVWPAQPWFASRHRWIDVVVYVGIGVALLVLSPWVAAAPA